MTDAPSDDAATALPDVIRRYQAAHDHRDADAALSAFGPNAVVVDDGSTASGSEQIRHWLENAASEFTYERTLIGLTLTGPDEWLVVNNLTGNFPGGTVDLSYRFSLRNGLIHELFIAPKGG